MIDSLGALMTAAQAKREQLFTLLEMGLIERMAYRDIPEFITRTGQGGEIITALTGALWELYHETDCALHQKDRTVWTRYRSMPTGKIEVNQLLVTMIDIFTLIRLDELAQHREVSKEEHNVVDILHALINHYRTRFGLDSVLQ